jgi:hypothetical protein
VRVYYCYPQDADSFDDYLVYSCLRLRCGITTESTNRKRTCVGSMELLRIARMSLEMRETRVLCSDTRSSQVLCTNMTKAVWKILWYDSSRLISFFAWVDKFRYAFVQFDAATSNGCNAGNRRQLFRLPYPGNHCCAWHPPRALATRCPDGKTLHSHHFGCFRFNTFVGGFPADGWYQG